MQNFSRYWRLDGSYPHGVIADTIKNELMFGVHPYFNFKFVGTTSEEWDASFGAFAASHPLLVSEWNENATRLGPLEPKWCEPPPDGKGAPVTTPLLFLHYLRDRHINGVVGWAFDMPGTIVRDLASSRPTTMDEAICGSVPGGVGEWLQDYFTGKLPSF